MSAYNPPTEITPIFNKSYYISLGASISQTQLTAALAGYVGLSSAQTISGAKTFSSYPTLTTVNGVAGGQALQVNSLTAPYATRLYSVNTAYSTDLYYPQFNGIDALVSRASTDALYNKDLTAATNKFPSTLLGYAQITTNFATSSASFVQVTGLTATVTVPSGRGVKITVFSEAVYVSLAGQIYLSLWQGTVGSGTQLQMYQMNYSNSSVPAYGMSMVYYAAPAPGSYTYNVGLKTNAGTATIEAAATYPAFILVELC